MTGYIFHPDPNGFYHWMMELSNDAQRRGVFDRFSRATDFTIWHEIFTEGVNPTVTDVIAWCLADPERFLDLRLTEKICTPEQYTSPRKPTVSVGPRLVA